MKLCSLKDDSAHISNTEEKAFVSLRELARLTSINSNLSSSFSLPKYRNPKYGRYSLGLCSLAILNSFILGRISNKYYFAFKDIRKAFVGVKRALL
jgi:hypothetical protein